MDDIKAKQQIVEKIKSSTNILVTVSNDPSVDALSAALGLTLLLDKLEKHPTAVFSGEVPPAIAFLEPEKTFDTTTDSLRDFIIALDKEKADHLRYKVEGDSVRIFITPYKTTITSDDLEFSQGDFNVELVIALGVDVQEHLDGALDSHGQILHDATIITVTAGDQVSNLGGIDWHDDQASSLSEMITGLSEALKPDKKPILDATIASAFLTGIVAQTDRFSNAHTTSKVMTVAANLMAAGADQQLIAAKLQASNEIGTTDTSSDDSTDTPDAEPEETPVEEAPRKDVLSITHEQNETLEQMDKRVKAAEQAEAAKEANEQLSEHVSHDDPAGAYAVTDDHKDEESVAEAPAPEPTPEVAPEPIIEPTPEPTLADPIVEPAASYDSNPGPVLGGTLNATSEQAADDARREQENDQNKTILTHAYMQQPAENTPETPAAPAPAPVNQVMPHEMVIQPPVAPIISTPVDLGLPMPPALPDFSLPPAIAEPAPAYAYGPAEPIVPQPEIAPQPEILGDILAPEPQPAQPVAPIAPAAPVSNDPGQFKIPGQQ